VKDAGFVEVMDSMDDEEGKLPFVKVFAEAFMGMVLDYISLCCNLKVIHSDLFRFQIVVVFHYSIVPSEFDPEFSCGKIPSPNQQSLSLDGG
jgi:hypothetical protein